MWLNKGYKQFLRSREFCTQILLKKRSTYDNIDTVERIPEPEYDISFLCNPSNRDTILNNIMVRKGVGDIDKVLQLSQKPELEESFLYELSKIPNQTDPALLSYGNEPQLIKECGRKPEFDFLPQEFSGLESCQN